MTEAQLNRKQIALEEIPRNGHLLLLSDQQKDNVDLVNINLSASSFIRLGMKEALISDCSFTQSNFEDSYFRKATFKNVRFTGSSFRHCNFEKASFQACDFRYCNFYYCKLSKDEIISCLPPEPNLRKELARNLRANFELIGDKKSADTFLDIEIQANEEELKAIFFSNTEYYKKHFNLIDQIKAGLRFCGSKISGMIWGYGHRVYRLLFSYVIIIFILSMLTYYSEVSFIVTNNINPRPLTLLESVYMGFGETVSLSGLPFVPANLPGKIIALSESFLGTLFLALLAATLYRRIAR